MRTAYLPGPTAGPDLSADALLDGDTLVCRLSPDRGIDRGLAGILDTVGRFGSSGLRHVLIDCRELIEIDAALLDAFGAFGDELGRRRVELLLLDAGNDVSATLAPRLPYATWIDSATGTRLQANEVVSPG